MAAGQQHKSSPAGVSVGCIIQARMRSSRLPGKSLMPIPLGDSKPMIRWIIDQASSIRYRPEVIVATSTASPDDPLAGYCLDNSIAFYRGDEENVLSRFAKLAETGKYDLLVRLTGDNPLQDVGVLDHVISRHLESGNDYTASRGLPTGMNVEVIAPERLTGLEMDRLESDEKEHVTLHIKRDHALKKEWVEVEEAMPYEQLRLTVDYPADFAVLSGVLSFYKEGEREGLDLVRYVAKNFPWLFEVNREIVQKHQFSSRSEELQRAGELLRSADMDRAADLLAEALKGLE